MSPESVPACRFVRRRLLDLEIFRRRDVQKILDEIVPAAADEIKVSPFAVVHVGHQEHVEILVGFDQGVNQPHRFNGVDVVVHVAVNQQEMALQFVG